MRDVKLTAGTLEATRSRLQLGPAFRLVVLRSCQGCRIKELDTARVQQALDRANGVAFEGDQAHFAKTYPTLKLGPAKFLDARTTRYRELLEPGPIELIIDGTTARGLALER